MLYLYLSDEEIALIQTAKGLIGKEKIIASSRKQIPSDLVVDGSIQNPDKLIIEIRDCLANGYPKEIKETQVTLVICDNQIFTHRLKIPLVSKSTDIASSVVEEIKKVIPIDITQLVNFYKQLNPETNDGDIFYTAIAKASVLSFANFFKNNGMKLRFLTAKSQSVFQFIKPVIAQNDIWLYTDIEKEKLEFFVFDSFGLRSYLSEKLGKGSFAGKIKSTFEQLQKEKGEKFTKLIIGGSGSIDLLLSEITDSLKITVVKIAELVSEVIKSTNTVFDTGGVPTVLFTYPLGLLLLTKTASPANFASDIDDIKKEEVVPVSLPPAEKTVTQEIKEEEPVKPADSTQMLPGQSQIVEYKKSSLAHLFANKIFLIILSVLIGFGVIAFFFFLSQKTNVSLPFMVSPSLTPTPTIIPTLTPTPTMDVKLKRSDLKIAVQNGTDKTGFAKDTATFLEGKGYKNIAKSNADREDYEKTVIKIKKDKENYLTLIKSDLTDKFDTSTVESLETDNPQDVIIILGKK